MKIYVSGPIANTPNYRRNFNVECDRLRELGHGVINPTEAFGYAEPAPDGLTYADFMRFHIASILQVDAMVMLEGWTGSIGATFECEMARLIGIPIYDEGELRE